MLKFKPEVMYTIIFFIMTLSIPNYNIWSMLMPYYFSHAKIYNTDVTIKHVFNSTILTAVGIYFDALIFPSLLFVFGLKKTLLLGTIGYALSNIAMCYFSSILSIAICAFMIGACFKNLTTCVILYFTENFTPIASKCYTVANTGFLLTGFVWANLVTYYVNPENKDMEAITYINGFRETYFEEEIAIRFRMIMLYQAIFSFSIVFVFSFFIKDPEIYSSKIGVIFDWIKGERVEISKSLTELELSISKSFAYIKVGDEKIAEEFSKTQIEVELIEQKSENLLEENNKSYNSGEDLKPSPQVRARQAFKSFKFWLLFILSVFRLSSSNYFIDNTKIFGFTVVKNDQLITQVYSLSSFAAMLGAAASSFIFDLFGLVNCYIGSIGLLFIADFIGMTILKNSPIIFLFMITFTRTHLNFNKQLTNITFFSCYEPEVTLHLARIYEFFGFVALFIMVVINEYFYINEDFTYAYGMYFILDGLALLVAIFVLKRFL